MTDREKAIERLAEAITVYRERLPKDPRERPAFVVRLAKDYRISVQTMREAIRMLREMKEKWA